MFEAISQLWAMLLSLFKAGTATCNTVLNLAEAGEVTSKHFKDNILTTLDLVEEPTTTEPPIEVTIPPKRKRITSSNQK